jgi:hypothetical protein
VTHQDKKRGSESKGHSLPVEYEWKDNSGQEKKASKPEALTHCQVQSKRSVRKAKGSQRARDTHSLSGTGVGAGQAKENRRARGTHNLSGTQREACQDSDRKLGSKVHSRPVKHTEKDSSGHKKKAGEQGELTNCRAQEGVVKATKEDQQARGTHIL